MLTLAGEKEHLLKNFSHWPLLANSEYCKIFTYVLQKHMQTAASENVFMKQKRKLSQHFEKEIYQYVI